MATLKVTLNTRIENAITGCIQQDNASYWDPITGVNLTRDNPTSADISGFTNTELANIANAVKAGTLSVVTGSLPAATDTYKSYSLFASAGEAGGPGWTGITGVAANEF